MIINQYFDITNRVSFVQLFLRFQYIYLLHKNTQADFYQQFVNRLRLID